MKTAKMGAFLGVLGLFVGHLASAQIHVDVNSDATTPDGLSWDTAYTTIQEGIDHPDATIYPVWVAEGEYVESIALKSGVKVYGGYPKGGGTRDTAANVTIINGNGAYHTVTIGSGAAAITNALVDGFTIKGGNADGTGGAESYYGGGVFFENADTTNGLANCLIEGNQAGFGAGIACYAAASPLISDCTINSNVASISGGGLAAFGTCAPGVSRCVFAANSATQNGGGVYLSNGDQTLSNCIFDSNDAAQGGGMYCTTSSGAAVTQEVRHCTFYGNTAGENGGGLFCASAMRGKVLSIANSIFMGNGQYAVYEAPDADLEPNIVKCLFYENPDGDYYDSMTDAQTGADNINLNVTGALNNLEGNPRFVDALAGDFHLQDGSVALERGSADWAVPVDIDGEGRPGNDGLIDIGVDEADALTAPADATAPVSRVRGLPAATPAAVFNVPYRVSDTASGFQYVELYYRYNGGAWTKYGGTYADNPISFDSAATGGDGRYDFYTIATDEANNVEAAPAEADDSTVVITAFAGATVYVDQDATGAETGASWANALHEIGAGVIVAINFGADQVWVAEGTYSEAITIDDIVKVYGGFTGVEADLVSRDPVANVTTIDGSQADYGAPAKHVVYLEYTTDSWLDGFTITGGQADRGFEPDNGGGGIYCDQVDNTNTIAQCVISDNAAALRGAGVCLINASPGIVGCSITENTSQGSGGAIFCQDASPALTNCVIAANTAVGPGGAIHSGHDASPTITNCSICDNTSSGMGGGFFCGSYNPISPVITNTVFRGNAEYAICRSNEGGSTPNLQVSYCLFYSNQFYDSDLGADQPGDIYDAYGAANPYAGATDVNGLAWASDCLDGAPAFISLAAGDYRLRYNSACIDAGDSATGGLPDTDAAGNPRIVNGLVDIGAYELNDLTAPGVVSVLRMDPSPTTSATVRFSVTFSEEVSGVDASDFALIAAGKALSGATIQSVTGVGDTYTVTVSTGTGEGTLRLDVSDDDSVKDGVFRPLGGSGTGNGAYEGGESYTVDTAGPGITISAPSSNSTILGPVLYTVIYTDADAVTLAAGDVTLNTTGTAVGTVAVTGAGNVSRTVQVTSVSGVGTISISIAAGTATDANGNPSLAAGPSQVFQVTNPDSDGDGINDQEEAANGLNPNNPNDGVADVDGDGLLEAQEINTFGTEILEADTDGDGMADGFEAMYGLAPLDDSDAGEDADGDGLTNLDEYLQRSNPNDPNSPRRTFFVSTAGSDVAGDGTANAPWRSIGYAIGQTGAKQTSMAIVVLPGTYSETVVLRPGLTLRGSLTGTAIIEGSGPTVVTGAEGCALQNVTISQAADDPTPETTLLLLEDVSVEVRDVTFRGNTARQATGIVVRGLLPGTSLITDCDFSRLGIGIEVFGAVRAIRRCVFDDLAQYAVVFREIPGGKSLFAEKMLGDADDPNTGYNTFGETDTGIAVRNERDDVIAMENNDWGVGASKDASDRVEGPADQEPALAEGAGLLVAAVNCVLLDHYSLSPISGGSATVGTYTVTADTNGVYVFACVAPGTYDMSASASDYNTMTKNNVVVAESAVMAVTFDLMPDSTATDTDGDGLSDTYEGQIGTDPLKKDTDGDGMNDDVEIAYGTDPTDGSDPGCLRPGAPANVSASDGAYADRVSLTWVSSGTGVTYKVYRNSVDDSSTATALSGWISATQYDDMTAAAPASSSGGGCGGGSTQYTHYYYWVKANNSCGESLFSDSDSGYRGKSAAKAGSLLDIVSHLGADERFIYEKALPSSSEEGVPALVDPDGPLAVRLRSEGPIDPESIWAWVACSDPESVAIRWMPAGEGELRDLWVIAEPQRRWAPGEEVTFTAGADEIDSVAFQFRVRMKGGLSEPAVSQPEVAGLNEPAVEVFQLDPASLPELESGVGTAFRIGPAEVFDAPRRVWLPLPADMTAGQVELRYFHEAEPGRGWYPAANVLGWAESASELECTSAGVRYVGMAVRHGGIARLRCASQATSQSAAVLPLGGLNRGNAGDLLMLIGVSVALLLAGKRSVARRSPGRR